MTRDVLFLLVDNYGSADYGL